MATQTIVKSAAIATPSRDELIDRAKALFPLFRAANAEAEKLGMVPNHVIAAAHEAGIFNIVKPALYGGYEHEPQVLYEVLFELGRASTACGWAVGLIAMHNWEVALLDPRVAEEIWGRDPKALISSSYAPFGKAQPTEGGYRVDGRWPWSSGSDHCKWAVLGTRVPAEDSPIGFHHKAMIVSRNDYEVDQDSWHMAGMQGSGSKDVVVTNAFVPEYRHHCITSGFFKDYRPGRDAFPAKTFRYPFGVVFGWTLASIVIGSAAGAIDLYVERMRKKLSVHTGAPVSEDPFNQQRVAEAAAMVYAAKAAVRHDFAEMSAELDADGEVPLERRAFYKFNMAFHARAASAAIAMMIKAAGGGAFALDQELQRFSRDAQVVTNHIFLNADTSSKNYGEFVFTGKFKDFVI